MIWGFIAAAVVSFAFSYAQARRAQRAAEDAGKGTLITKEATDEAIPVIYGTRRVGGTRVYTATTGDDNHKFLYEYIVFSEGEIESISNLEIDDVPFTNDNNLLTSAFEDSLILDSPFSANGYRVWFEVFSGTEDQAPVGISIIKENMTTGEVGDKSVGSGNSLRIAGHEIEVGEDTNFRSLGVAGIAIRYEWAESNNPFTGGKPKLTALVKGKKVYDMRKDSTSAYYDPSLGVTTHRQNDPSTWEWSNNNAICLRDYLWNSRYGKGLQNGEIDDASFAQAATDLDSFTVTPYDGADVRPLFSCNAVVNTDDTLFDNVDKMIGACRGFMPYNDGKYKLYIDQKVTDPNAVVYLNEDSLVDSIKLTGAKKEGKFNQVIVKYPDAAQGYEYNQVAWPDPASSTYTTITSATAYPDGRTPGSSGHLTESQLSSAWVDRDGESLVDEVDLEYVTDYYAARDMARILCLRSRFSLKATVTATSEATNLVPGDVVFIGHQTMGWDRTSSPFGEGNGYFQVEEVALNPNGVVELSLIEFHNSIYTYDPAELYAPSTGSPKGGSLSSESLEARLETQLQASLGWTFANSDHAWYYNNITQTANASYLSIEATNSDPYMTSPTIAVSGALAPYVIAKIRRTAGSGWDGSIAYATTGHAIDYPTYRKTIDDPTLGIAGGDWQTVIWDMTDLTVGGTDWTDSVITAIELHLGNTADDVFDIQYLFVGFKGVSVTQINSDNIRYFIGDLAVNTLQIADNAVTVPEVDVDPATYVGDGATYHATATVDVTLPADNIPISLWWAIEHGYPSYPTTGGWQYKLKRDGVVIDSRLTTMVAAVDYMTGLTVDTGTSTAGTTHTYVLEWWGENSNIQLQSATLFALGAAK